MTKYIWVILAFVAGAFLPIQGGMNARLGKELGNPIGASIVSFVIGLLTLLGYFFITQQKVNFSNLASIPKLYFLGGVLGACFVTIMIMALPRIGAALTFGLVVAGQLGISLFLDHYNILVQQQHPINGYRVIGLILIIAGVVLIRRF